MKCYESTREERNQFSQQSWKEENEDKGKHKEVTSEVGFSQAEQSKLNTQSWQQSRPVQGCLVGHAEGVGQPDWKQDQGFLLFLKALTTKK